MRGWTSSRATATELDGADTAGGASWAPSLTVACRAPAKAEVRITAQRLADGRTEFALQQREADVERVDGADPRLAGRPRQPGIASTPLTVTNRLTGPIPAELGGGDNLAHQHLSDRWHGSSRTTAVDGANKMGPAELGDLSNLPTG